MANAPRRQSLPWLIFLVMNILTTPVFADYIPTLYKPFPAWNVTSSATAGNNISALSTPGLDTSSWLSLGSKGTLMSTLLHNNIHNESHIFYSTNLKSIDSNQFRVPWYYRWEGVVDIELGKEYSYLIQTNGIAARADVWFNGQQIVEKERQAGAYVGFEFEVSGKMRWGERNVLLVRVWPTDYNKDLALGFVDWSPYPPDNGTGIWRDINIRRTGQVVVSGVRVTTRAALDGAVDIYLDIKNLNPKDGASGYIDCAVYDPNGQKVNAPKSGFDLSGGEQTKIEVKAKVNQPQIWWPRQWGDQPLYSVQCNASTRAGGLTDASPLTRFGMRTVTSKYDAKNKDTTFFINGQRFQVLGGGYTSDMFLRFDENKLRAQFQYVLNMGLNTVRLEGKQEHKFLYDLADEMGIMIMAGWECCDKWEGWSYNDEGSGEKWKDADYTIANNSMRHEAELMRSHPSMLTFLIGSDFWPDDRATKIYVDALKAYDWDVPIISSASQRGFPAALGNGGMKMEGPYDWVPPNYWYDKQQRLGSAAGFGSELGAGVGTPEIGSLKKFLSASDLDDLWKENSKNKGLYHMSTDVSSFYTREIYNGALWARYGAPTSLSDYLLKAQMADYEATRAQFQAYLSRWSKSNSRPATGLIYWMLNNAWPSLHWNLFDYYLHPGGSYFGTKAALASLQSAIYDYSDQSVYITDRRVAPSAPELPDRRVDIEVIGLDGKLITKRSIDTTTELDSSRKITSVPGLADAKDVVLLRLILAYNRRLLSRNVYWLAPQNDVLDWDNSTWYHTPVTSFSNYTSLNTLAKADVEVRAISTTKISLENKSKIPAVFLRLNLVDGKGEDVLPVTWTENYITLWPGEKMDVEIGYGCCQTGVAVEVEGRNVERRVVTLQSG